MSDGRRAHLQYWSCRRVAERNALLAALFMVLVLGLGQRAAPLLEPIHDSSRRWMKRHAPVSIGLPQKRCSRSSAIFRRVEGIAKASDCSLSGEHRNGRRKVESGGATALTSALVVLHKCWGRHDPGQLAWPVKEFGRLRGGCDPHRYVCRLPCVGRHAAGGGVAADTG